MTQPEASFSRRPHGANPEKLYAAMGLPMPERIVDFSVNTNVLPSPVTPEIDLIRCLSEYPDDDALALRTLVAEREGRSLDEVLFTNGSNEALYLLASLFVGMTAAVLQPAYGEYRRALEAFGVPTADIFDLRDVEGKALAFVCNPCNPTGSCIPFGELEARARANPRTLFAVDQAYLDFLLPDGEEASPDFGALPNILLLRSLTKLYHLCGARIGYVLASPSWVERLKGRQPTWSVNAIAQETALSLMKDGSYARRTRAFYSAETPRFMEAVARSGFRVRPSRVHFFLIEVDDDVRVIRGLLERGLVVRHTRNFPGLDGSCIRVATRMPEENDLLVQALSSL
ncbi:aminotransferase class I/II-fold pyridoxal phosphate-dependent enzyme [uncultured Fretibacterium sp.]|uniref:aminotransferase class I/II-fold pyridoxal phosphate-dependent enzyme n=1 Tax=uncultured Fretibacterium sp. TaxID=1678694 RepID=UPI00261DB872|nr:aminotransferase class I/II-fold pyridoxal phosphate-dependent enzyme [uncultured Fretibacterium sp.]